MAGRNCLNESINGLHRKSTLNLNISCLGVSLLFNQIIVSGDVFVTKNAEQ